MSYNKELLKNSLHEITKDTFKEAVFLCYRDGITSVAPLGFSGDTVLIHGVEGNGRRSAVSVRNYCGHAELLITDIKGAFLFYGRYDINLGIGFITEQYWQIFNQVKDCIELDIPKISEFKKAGISENCNLTEGWNMLKSYQLSQKES